MPQEDEELLADILDELCLEGRILLTKKKKYISVDNETQTMAGRLSCNSKGYFGFVISDNEDEDDVFVSGDDMGNALHGDRVLVRIDKEEKGTNKKQGHI
ncbi:MAG: ribonuclease R, partial [Clostridia bacterium]|nr:ribonuclease R [Clostridia bacterium]